MGWKESDDLSVTLSEQLEKIIRKENVEAYDSVFHHAEGIDLVPANIETSGVEVSIVNVKNREFTMNSYLENLKKIMISF